LRKQQANLAAASVSPRLAAPDEQDNVVASRRDSTRGTVSTSASSTLVDQDAEEDVANADVANPLIEQRVTDTAQSAVSGQLSSKPVYIGGSACAAFATRLRSHVSGANDAPIDPSLASAPSSDTPCLIPVYKHPRLLRSLNTPFELPSRAYGMMLVQVVLRFVGNDYHFVRKKDFVRRLNAVYDEYSGQESSKISPGKTDPVFLCRVFAVFALGELYLKKTAMTEGGVRVVPGTNFFLQATSLFQELYEDADVEYIETLLLLVSPTLQGKACLLCWC
jgi:proline utilization trans-activator